MNQNQLTLFKNLNFLYGNDEHFHSNGDFETQLSQLYQEQFDFKRQQLVDAFQSLEMFQNFSFQDHYQSFSSPIMHYRMRAEFRVWHDRDQFDFIMFDQNTKNRIPVKHFLPANQLINGTMNFLKNQLMRISNILVEKLFQVDFLSSSMNHLVISFLYHKKLSGLETELMEKGLDLIHSLESYLNQDSHIAKFSEHAVHVSLVIRAKNQKIIVQKDTRDLEKKDWVLEKILSYDDRPELFVIQKENSFSQPNYTVSQKMLQWVYSAVKTNYQGGDLLELYCGNGNFSLSLARLFPQIFATEISKSSIECAEKNIVMNGILNMLVKKMNAEEVSEALSGVREFQRLKGIDINQYNFQWVLVDPPRSGIDDQTLVFISQFSYIVYVSCNPSTLTENLSKLSSTHRPLACAFFDQFPYTPHLESGVILQKK